LTILVSTLEDFVKTTSLFLKQHIVVSYNKQDTEFPLVEQTNCILAMNFTAEILTLSNKSFF